MENNTLPADIHKQIRQESEEYAESYGRKIHGYYSLNYIAGATAWAIWKVKHDQLQQDYKHLQTKYDNILATEDGLPQTENVWQSGYAAGHDAGYERRIKDDTKLQQQYNQMKVAGNTLALALRRFVRSVSVHPDYSNNSEWGDYVSGAEKAMAAWEGEQPQNPPFEIKPGMEFRNKSIPGYTFTVIDISTSENAFSVTIKCDEPPHDIWCQNDCDLQHALWAFEKGEYYVEKEVKP